ncbi:hypothetical protein T10_8831 [Trichinella papuae]|uniref:Uncharacterized protein n=1 Tax=Trichinella papuae TaxID=268474 RepID=A0A0V1LYC4_9BILA|nr:hypothetical protein T10_8831 [Trichinella papuae]
MPTERKQMAPVRKAVEAFSFHEAVGITFFDVSYGAPFVNYPFPSVGISKGSSKIDKMRNRNEMLEKGYLNGIQYR